VLVTAVPAVVVADEITLPRADERRNASG